MANEKSKKKNKRKVFGSFVPVALLVVASAVWKYWDYRLWFAVGCIAIAVFGIALYIRRYRLSSKMAAVDRMDGFEFERFLVGVFNKLGYKTEHVGALGGDFGADLIVERDGVRIAVQAKNYGVKNAVGNDAVQQAVAGAAYYDCDMAMVVTNSSYTKAAKEQAARSNIAVALWDRKDLGMAIRGNI